MADYIVRGAKMYCNKGSNERKINLPESHGSYVIDKPILNEKDSTEENISYFGVCSEEGCFTATEKEPKIDVIDKDGVLKNGVKCSPIIVTNWLKTQKDNLIDGEPALTTESVIYCCRGGNIKFVSSGQ
ncbi:DUF4280 domain-containing protein [uncultured Clostridium sp.]|uniref:DUF4280 domain-containing protein n=1 Tax=uncultured Clostridium sp. TaxID=59620 RepID=UPI0025E051D1|nr:DUF4280 domain-containing protein [uncultured Clostridium sp.]